MPTNVPPEYYKVMEEYKAEKDKRKKIQILQKAISILPKHKGTEHLIGDLKAKISKLKKEIQTEEKKKKAAKKKGIKKEGAAQVVLVGFPNSGKSYIMNKFCNTNLASTEIPFETSKPEVGMLDINGVKVQLIEIPSIYPGFWEKRGIERGLIQTADLICFVLMDDELEELKKEIKIKKAHTSIKRKELKKLKEKIWNKLGLIKVYTKSPGKKSEEKPVALKVGATIEDLGEKIHKDFIKKFKYAKVFRKHGKIKEIQAGLKFVLKDEDIVEFHLK